MVKDGKLMAMVVLQVRQGTLSCKSMNKVQHILLSNCLGGPFGKKWTDVGAEWNERSEVHSSADASPLFQERINSFLVIDYPIEHFFLPYFDFSLQPVHSTSNGPPLSQSECVI